jgi:hypothetical protein
MTQVPILHPLRTVLKVSGPSSHRAGVAYGDDGLFVDLEGVPSIKRTVLSASFKPERVSDLIDPESRRL